MTALVRPSQFWDHTRDLSLPHHRRKVDALKDSIAEHGYRPDWVDLPIRAGYHDGAPWIGEGHHRLKALQELGLDDPIPMHIPVPTRTAQNNSVCDSSRNEYTGSYERIAAKGRSKGQGQARGRDQQGAGGRDSAAAQQAVQDGQGAGQGPVQALRGLDSVEFHGAARKDIRKLDPPLRRRAVGKIETLANSPQHSDGTTTERLSRHFPDENWHSTRVDRGTRIVHRTHEDGHLYVGGVFGQHDYDAAVRRLGTLSDESLVSVAEHAMEQSGHAGRSWHVPKMHADDPARREAHQPVHDFVRGVLAQHGYEHAEGIHVSPSHWDLREPGSGQAMVNGMGTIGLKGEHTNDMTLLHECAHILTRTPEGPGGHGPDFQQAAHRLYHEHISPQAADTFNGIVHALPREASTYTVRLEHGRYRPDNKGIEHPIGVSHVHVEVPNHDERGNERDWHSMDTEAHQTAAQMSSYPGADMVTKSDIIRLEAAVRALPSQRVFGPTFGLDKRLWEPSGALKPDVRAFLLRKVGTFLTTRYGPGWEKWARIYFAGSEASMWTGPELIGNSDFDTLIGINYKAMRKAVPALAHMTNGKITDMLNYALRENLRDPAEKIEIDGEQTGPWDATFYVNPDSWDITKIRPYAAYDVGADKWAVKPPDLPNWSLGEFPKTVLAALKAAERYARDVLKLPEPQRTQQGAALFDAWHSDRSRAFSPHGHGWYDFANLREKWLDQTGVWKRLVDAKHRDDQGLGMVPDWSNTPTWGKAAMGHAGPDYDNLSFRHEDSWGEPYSDGKWGNDHHLIAQHPEHGDVGKINFDTNYYPQGHTRRSVAVGSLDVHPDHRRRGVGTALIHEVERRYPDTPIDHGMRTPEGAEWAQSRYGPGTAKAETEEYYPGRWTKNGRPWDPRTGREHTASAATDALVEVGRREHPNVEHYQSGGMGHQEGDESRSVVGFMPTREMKRYREHAGDWHPDSDEIVGKIRDDIRNGTGIRTPLMVQYSDKDKWGYLGEGNHRLRAADEEGAKTVPVRVVRDSDLSGRKRKGIGAPMDLGGKFDQPSGPYTPSDIHPHHFIREARTDKWPPYLTERTDPLGDTYPVNESRANPRGPVMSESDAQSAGYVGPYFHGTHQRRARDIRANGFRQPRMHNWEMEGAGNAEEVDLGHTHRTFFTEKHEDAMNFAQAHHGDDADVVKAYLHPAHMSTEEGGGWMPSVQVKDVAHAVAISDKRKTAVGPSRLERAWGSHDENTLFGDGPTTPVPWDGAGRRKDRKDYDPDLVKKVITEPEHHHMQDVDPRTLRATQPSVTRGGVRHYLSGHYDRTGETFAEPHNPGNRRPVVYRREDGQHLLLSGHHRATAALLQGRPLQALVVDGPWGESRR